MPECIVCKGYYDPDDPKTKTECRRCGSDNISWEKWRKDEPVEQKGVRGLIHFTGPHCHLPFFIILVAAALGLMGMGIEEVWEEVNLFACLLAAAASVGLSSLTLLWVYVKRHKLREDYLLERVKTAVSESKPKKIPETPYVKVESRFALALVMVVALVMLVACVLVSFDISWKLSEILFIEEKTPTPTATPVPGTTPTSTQTPTPTPTGEATKAPARPGLTERVKRAVPLIFLSGYIGLFPALVYASSMLLAQTYTKRMNQELPHPIFLQDEKLTRVVRREAEVELERVDPRSPPDNIRVTGYFRLQGQAGSLFPRLPSSTNLPIIKVGPSTAQTHPSTRNGDPSLQRAELWGQVDTWIWDELERTDDGGIKMKVARQEVYQLPKQTEESGINPGARVSYVVRADPWGRITEIKRDGK